MSDQLSEEQIEEQVRKGNAETLQQATDALSRIELHAEIYRDELDALCQETSEWESKIDWIMAKQNTREARLRRILARKLRTQRLILYNTIRVMDARGNAGNMDP